MKRSERRIQTKKTLDRDQSSQTVRLYIIIILFTI